MLFHFKSPNNCFTVYLPLRETNMYVYTHTCGRNLASCYGHAHISKFRGKIHKPTYAMVGVLVVHQILQFADILFHNQMHGSEDSQGLGNVRLFQ